MRFQCIELSWDSDDYKTIDGEHGELDHIECSRYHVLDFINETGFEVQG